MDAGAVSCVTDEAHEQQLTREELASAIHYIRFAFTPAQVARFAGGTVTLRIAHPAYREETLLTPETKAALLEHLRE